MFFFLQNQSQKMFAPKCCVFLVLVILFYLYPIHSLYQFEIKPSEHPESVKVAQIIHNFLRIYFSDKNVYLSIFTDAGATAQFQNDLLINLAKDPTLNSTFSFLNISMSSRSQPFRYRFPIDIFLFSIDRLDHIR